jgi:hypothetical protein
MTPSRPPEAFSLDGRRPLLLAALSGVLVLLFARLLALDAGRTLAALLLGMPLIALCLVLSRCHRGERLIRMGLAMFVAGGIGMLLGSLLDGGPLGLYALLSLCQSLPLDFTVTGLQQYWQKMQLSPGTYLGMLLGGNLGMLLLGGVGARRAGPGPRPWRVLLACNAGMLAGMLLAERLMNAIVAIPSQLTAITLMVTVMLLTMTLGMLLALSLLDRFGAPRQEVLP